MGAAPRIDLLGGYQMIASHRFAKSTGEVALNLKRAVPAISMTA